MEPETVIRLCKKIIECFPREYKEVNAFRVLISTVISQRNRDEITEKISLKLFNQYPTILSMAEAKLEDLQNILRMSGMYYQKSQRIREISQRILEKQGKVPETLAELLLLPGVGRKTANIVLSVAFGIPALAVDTHVHRISNRMGFVTTKTPEHTERELMKVLPDSLWGPINGSMVEFGKKICKPVRPKCEGCDFPADCEYFEKITHPNPYTETTTTQEGL